LASAPPKRVTKEDDWKSFSCPGGESLSMISPKVAILFILAPVHSKLRAILYEIKKEIINKK
jgi:hypothetical protein